MGLFNTINSIVNFIFLGVLLIIFLVMCPPLGLVILLIIGSMVAMNKKGQP